MWDLAQIILKTVVKLKTGVAEVIIKQLSKRIMYSKVKNFVQPFLSL